MALLYKRVAFADSPFNPTASTLDDLNANQNSLAIDFDLTAGAIVVNLPSIESLLFGQNSGAGGFTFYINGNIVTGSNVLSIVANASDKICGSTTAFIGSLDVNNSGFCFHLFIAGRHDWCIMVCKPSIS